MRSRRRPHNTHEKSIWTHLSLSSSSRWNASVKCFVTTDREKAVDGHEVDAGFAARENGWLCRVLEEEREKEHGMRRWTKKYTTAHRTERMDDEQRKK